MQRLLQTVVLLLLPLFAGGCMTQKLWSDSALDEWNEPAAAANLHLFEAPQRNDIFVVYDEYSERTCSTRTRAFFLNQNQDQLFRRVRPRFVKSGNAAGLKAVPVFMGLPPYSFPKGYCAVTTPAVPVFTLYSDGHEHGSYELPVYNDGIGRAQRIALTPVAVTVDATIAGGILGCLCFYGLGESDYQWRP